uniref:Uncharacterized protein n=1 Tax=Helicoverpa zea single nucleopolyhedrovirus TaxID=10468 RepID=A0A0H4AKM2_9ABAC|nr:hypothetical protein [Helicoverpa zea single nucleopolyhedrovirus]UCC42584.1 hypothetical protein [Helicoverpa armigera nucleopolyhedrovirus]
MNRSKRSRPVSNEQIQDQFKLAREMLSVVNDVNCFSNSVVCKFWVMKQKIAARFKRKDPRSV